MPNPPPQEYVIGVMKVAVEEESSPEFHRVVEEATERLEQALTEVLHLRVELFEFRGPHLSPAAGSYSALDFLDLGLVEKLERHIHFLLVVTEVDLAASLRSYVLALPSQLTNVGILSTKRVSPFFWGDADTQEAAHDVTVRRLSLLMLHTIGHILNLGHADDPTNAMYDIQDLEDWVG